MFKVLIIDDELLVRELIKKSVDFPALGFEILGEAKDGRQALAMIDELHPDLLLLDINIPMINGITLAKKVNTQHPEIQIIILTGYSEFDYAKGAIEAGVLDYLLKPLNKTEFTKALLKAKELLSRQASMQQRIHSYQMHQHQLDKEALFLKLIEGSEDYGSLNLELLARSGIEPEQGPFGLAAILIDRLDELFSTQMEKNLWKYAVANITQEILESSFPCVVFQDTHNHIIMLASLGAPDREMLLRSCCHQICSSVHDTLKFTVTLGIPALFTSLRSLSSAYQDALWALDHRFLMGNARCIFREDLKPSAGLLSDCVEPGGLLLDLRSGSYEKAYNQAETLLSKSLSREQMIFLAVRLLSDIITCLEENRISSGHFELDEMLKKLLSIELGIELKQYVLDRLLEACELLSDSSGLKQNRTINEAIRYIDQNYADSSLTLTGIAKKLYLNSSYLSYLFKQETGLSLSEYLTKVRLREAKQILDEHTGCPLSLLAASVGYKDEYYFSKCFKKAYGISPKKYAEQKK